MEAGNDEKINYYLGGIRKLFFFEGKYIPGGYGKYSKLNCKVFSGSDEKIKGLENSTKELCASKS